MCIIVVLLRDRYQGAPSAVLACYFTLSPARWTGFETAKPAFRTAEKRACYGAAFCKPVENQTTVLNV